MLSLKKSLTEQPALPEEAQAQAQAQEEAHAQLEAQAEAQEEAQEERGLDPRLPGGLLPPCTGTLITLTLIKVLGELP